LLGLCLSYAAGILSLVKEIIFYVFCREKLNYANYFKNIFPVNIVVLFIKRIQEIISEVEFKVSVLAATLQLGGL